MEFLKKRDIDMYQIDFYTIYLNAYALKKKIYVRVFYEYD